MLKVYVAVVLGTILSFFADVAPWGGCCGGGRPPIQETPPGEPPTDSRLHRASPTRLAKHLPSKKNKPLAFHTKKTNTQRENRG
jgi:hypothetical protein